MNSSIIRRYFISERLYLSPPRTCFIGLDLCVIAEELGSSVAPTPFSSSVYLASEAIINFGDESQKKSFLPGLASGEKIGAFAHNETTTSPTEANISCSFTGGSLSGTKIAVADGDVANTFIVTANNGSGVGLYLVDGTADGIEVEPQSTLDPSRSHASITFSNTPATELKSDWSDVLSLLDRAAVLFSFEQLGGAEACMDMAKEYAMGRYAFGRSIASFQAIKHRLADLLLELELAKSACYQAAQALADNEKIQERSSLAKSAANEAFLKAGLECIQLHGGIGFTWENDTHLWFKRAKSSEVLLGNSAIHYERLLLAIPAVDSALRRAS